MAVAPFTVVRKNVSATAPVNLHCDGHGLDQQRLPAGTVNCLSVTGLPPRCGAIHSLYDVQKILGHSDPAVTQRYARLSGAALQSAANNASRAIRGAATKEPVREASA